MSLSIRVKFILLVGVPIVLIGAMMPIVSTVQHHELLDAADDQVEEAERAFQLLCGAFRVRAKRQRITPERTTSLGFALERRAKLPRDAPIFTSDVEHGNRSPHQTPEHQINVTPNPRSHQPESARRNPHQASGFALPQNQTLSQTQIVNSISLGYTTQINFWVRDSARIRGSLKQDSLMGQRRLHQIWWSRAAVWG
jgi:hypothetical protein